MSGSAFPAGLPPPSPWWRAPVGVVVRGALAAYFRRIERFHVERVPTSGPLLVVANHPGSVTDAFVLATSVPRMLHFVATVRLFQLAPLARLLSRCGVVPINRRQDNPTAMRTVADTFEHCFRVFERGGAIAIFPEGVSYDDEWLRPVKTGAARMSLEIEARHDGDLGLRILPVGLTYSAKHRYHSDVLVHVGEPFAAADWLVRYRDDPHDAVRALSTDIEQRIRALILDLPSLDHQRIVAAVKQLYLERLRERNLVVTEPMPPQAEELVLSQAIAQAIAHFERSDPDRLAGFVVDLIRYERRLWMFRLSDRSLSAATEPLAGWRRWMASAALAATAPIALYGWVHRFAPAWVVEWAVGRFAMPEQRRAQTAHASMIAGLVAFGALYAAAALVVGLLAGWTVAGWYGLSLPLTGVFSVYYVRALLRVGGDARAAWLRRRLPLSMRHLARQRDRLIREIEAFRADYRRDALGFDDRA